jgi:hypothetical protein
MRKQRIKISDIFIGISALLLVWILVSYVEAISCIDSGLYDYSWWNILTLIFG